MRGHTLGGFLRCVAGAMALVAVPAAPALAQGLCMGERPTIVGTSGIDHLEGTPARDVIVALDGDDTVEANDGDDLVCAGEGNDRVSAGAGDDRVDGGWDKDRVRGGDGNDDLVGGWDVDLLVGGAGDDRLSGGRDDPFVDRAVYVGSASPISADLAAGRVTGAATGTDELWHVEGVVGTSGADELLGNGLPNDFAGRDGDDTIDGRGGRDIIFGGKRYPFLQTADGRDVVHGGGGDDRISGGHDSDELFGDGGNDVLMSLDLDAQRGDPWNDTLEVAGTLHGGDGDDELVSGPGNDTLDGNGGLDLVSYTHAEAGVTVDLGAGSALGDGVDALVSIEEAAGTRFDDSLLGDDGPNVLDGYRGGDTVRGFGGDDRLSGRSVRLLEGGAGDDELALLSSFWCYERPPTPADAPALAGGPGNDILRSDPQGFTLDGGEGADTAVYSSKYAGMVIDLARGEAWRRNARHCFDTLGFHDTLVSIENAEGGRRADILLGNDAPNVLFGLGNQDRIEGGAGDDTIDGGPGKDSADGGDGDDTCANVEVTVSC